MRIIGGEHRSRRLATVRGEIRPTTDRARECLFNVLGTSVVGSVWLDAFCGTGAVGIEALSRGAKFINFNDRSFAAVQLLKKNLKLCGIEEGWEAQQKDVFTLLRNLKSSPLDFVFLDPPYIFKRHQKLLDRVRRLTCLKAETQVILETFKKTPIPSLPESLTLSRVVKVGDNQLLFLRPRLKVNS
mgnify:CR=1 FL=1